MRKPTSSSQRTTKTAPASTTPPPAFPMRLNKYLAWKKFSTRKASDDLIKKGQVFINNKKAEVGMMVQQIDLVEVKFRGKPTPYFYYAYNKPKGISTQEENNENKENSENKKENGNKKKSRNNENTHSFPKGVFPIGSLEKEAHGLMILTNDGRITDRLLSSAYADEKEYVVTTRTPLRGSFKQKMEAGPQIENEQTKPCKVTILNERTFVVTLTEEKRHEVRRMCSALFQEVEDIQRVRILNIKLANLQAGSHRPILGDELKEFLGTLFA
ncbi:MAG: pseudouridine synthase [bacterium]|nr:pseudouridine synthase [bacterium]